VVVNSTTITANFVISSSAPLGMQTVSVTSLGVTTATVQFMLNPPVPTITSISPAGGFLGSTITTVTITGTGFVSGPTFAVNVSGGTGITVTNAAVVNTTTVTATFMIAANASTPSQLVNVHTAGGTSNNQMFGVGANFMLMDSPTSQSVAPGAGAMTTVTITPTPASTNFPVNVTFTAAGLPSETTCNFTSTAAGFTGGSTGIMPAADGASASAPQVMLACTTTAPSLIIPNSPEPWYPANFHSHLALAWAGLLLALGAAFTLAGRQRKLRLRWALAAMLILAFAGFTSACGGGGGTPVMHNPGTPAGTYMITVTATSGNATANTMFTLTVQ